MCDGIYLMGENLGVEIVSNFIENYQRSHTHPINRLMHTLGIPMIVLSLPLFFFHWKIALIMFIAGWALQFLGHFIEGNSPAFFKNPLFLFIAPWWWFKKTVLRRGNHGSPQYQKHP